ncbi:39S ribosomal protein L14, mitochondrial [Lamellibrachia satsuma]|nr:39S ribosomal protein L14, mitochondrial [Lamellibrachia satsuma]
MALLCRAAALQGQAYLHTNGITTLRNFSISSPLQQIIKLSRLQVVDNSAIGRAAAISGRPAKCIHVYNKKGVGTLGDKILVAIKGQKKKAYIVGVKQKQKPFVPRFDSNNIVLVEESGMPTGTRIRVPIPSMLRGKEGDFTKILSIATKFV